MKTVQLPNSTTNNPQTVMQKSTENTDITLAKTSPKHLSDPSRAYGLTYNGKGRKRASNREWVEREYHVQYSKYAQHK